MNTNMKELSMNEMEQVSGGIIITATGIGLSAAVLGIAAAAVKVASLVYDVVNDKD